MLVAYGHLATHECTGWRKLVITPIQAPIDVHKNTKILPTVHDLHTYESWGAGFRACDPDRHVTLPRPQTCTHVTADLSAAQ